MCAKVVIKIVQLVTVCLVDCCLQIVDQMNSSSVDSGMRCDGSDDVENDDADDEDDDSESGDESKFIPPSQWSLVNSYLIYCAPLIDFHSIL